MIKHHPDINMLVEYTNGSLPWGLSLAVKAHIQLCAHCRQHAAQMNVLGSLQLLDVPKEAVADDSFHRLMARIQNTQHEKQPLNTQTPAIKVAIAANTQFCRSPLPEIIQKLIPAKMRWQKISRSLSMSRLQTGQQQYEVAFHKINKGGTVVEHDHKGLEVTLVLDGSFSDENGIYQRGDFLVREPGHIHRPTAALNQDCLCLSIAAAPVKVTGVLGKFINPFLTFKPA
jgi:putative transcriptional regulator